MIEKIPESRFDETKDRMEVQYQRYVKEDIQKINKIK